MAKPYRHGKKRGGRFVSLPEWLMASAAWQDLKPGPRALYVELKRRFNGGNNGEIFLSHRDAARALNMGREAVAGYFRALKAHGFIVETRGHSLGPSGIGQSATYALTEEALPGKPATKDFLRWRKQKPRRKTRHSLAGKSGQTGPKTGHLRERMSENQAGFTENAPSAVSENQAIYTSGHILAGNLAAGTGLCGKALEMR